MIIALGFSSLQASTDVNASKKVQEKQVQKEKVTHQENLNKWEKILETDLKNNKTENNMTIAVDYNAVGYFYNKTDQTEKALEHYLKAVKIAEDQTKPYSKRKTAYYNNTATAYEKLEKLPEALQYYKKALDIYKDKIPADHPYIATTSADIGNIYEKMGKNDKALEYNLEALNIRKKSLRPLTHSDTIYSYQKVIILYEKTKKYQEALNYGQKLIDLLGTNDKENRKDMQSKLDELQKKIDAKKTDKTKK